MEEARIAAWNVVIGQTVQPGDTLYEVETEKVTTGVDSTVAGTVLRLVVDVDGVVEVGALLAVISNRSDPPTEAEIDAFIKGLEGNTTISPAAPPTVTREPVQPGDAIRAMPRTRALAKSLGLDISTIIASGVDGLVLEDDVRAAAERRDFVKRSVSAPSVGADLLERRALSNSHQLMAKAVSSSWATVPQFTQTVAADVTAWRSRPQWVLAARETTITFTDLVLDAVVRASILVPEANSTYAGDHLLIYRDVNVAMAIDTPNGLVVPVLHRLDQLSAGGRARLRQDVTERARQGELKIDDVTGGTITVSNLGGTAVQSGVPILIEPFTAIVFIGKASESVVARAGAIAIREMCSVSITFDHRSVDGSTAARFTGALQNFMSGNE